MWQPVLLDALDLPLTEIEWFYYAYLFMKRMVGYGSAVGLGVALGVVALVGCTKAVGTLGARGYENTVFGYVVPYTDPSQRVLLSADWRLDNFVWDQAKRQYVEKRKGDYKAVREIDEDDNGEISDNERSEEAIYDLKFVNARDEGIIWIKAHPMRAIDKERELEVVLDGYIDSLSGRGLYAQGSLFNTVQVKSREFTSFVKEKHAVKVDHHPAVMAVIELAEVEKLKADPDYRNLKIKVVLTRFAYSERITINENPRGWPTSMVDGKMFRHRKGLLVLGYANAASRFDRSVGDFDALVERIQFPKSIPNLQKKTPPSPPTASTSAASTPAASSLPPAASSSPPPSPAQASSALPLAASTPQASSAPAAASSAPRRVRP